MQCRKVAVCNGKALVSVDSSVKLGLQYDADDARDAREDARAKTLSKSQMLTLYHLQYRLMTASDESLRACSS